MKIKKIKQETNTKKLDYLFRKHKSWMGTKYSLRDFKEPVIFFERRSGDVEFHEGATAGMFNYKHSDGDERFIILTPSRQKKYGIGRYKFKGYHCHEDFPLPLPEEPVLTAEQMNIIIEKSLNDMKEWKAKELKASGEKWLKIAGGVALILGVIVVAYIVIAPMMGKDPAPAVQVVRDTVIRNVSGTILR